MFKIAEIRRELVNYCHVPSGRRVHRRRLCPALSCPVETQRAALMLLTRVLVFPSQLLPWWAGLFSPRCRYVCVQRVSAALLLATAKFSCFQKRLNLIYFCLIQNQDGKLAMPAGSDHVITVMNDITAVTSFDASKCWLSRGCSVLLFVSAATTVTERDTGRLETPGCLRPRWAASSLGELAPNPPLNLVNSRSPLWFSSHSCWSSRSRFLLPEYLPYAGIFHERGQPGLATHSSVNRVLAGMRTHTPLFKKKAAHIRPPSGHGDHKVVVFFFFLQMEMWVTEHAQ